MGKVVRSLWQIACGRLPVVVLMGSLLTGTSACDTQTKQASGCNTSADCPGGQICGMTGQCLPKPKSITVTITKLGDGAGVVTSSPAGLDCGTTCSADFVLGQPITLTATPQSGSLVSGFSIGCNSSGATCTFTPTLDEPVQVGINFALQPPSQPPSLCNQAGFCWENPRPQGNRLSDVAVMPSGEVWAVGEVGTVVRRIGTTNSLLSSGTTQNLTGAAVVGAEVVMVGAGGSVMRGAGGLVTPETSGTLQDLLDVAPVGAGAVAVGVGGKILRRNGIPGAARRAAPARPCAGSAQARPRRTRLGMRARCWQAQAAHGRSSAIHCLAPRPWPRWEVCSAVPTLAPSRARSSAKARPGPASAVPTCPRFAAWSAPRLDSSP